jgi:putative transposase
MPRTARLARPNQYYHIYNRGANNQLIYKDKEDYLKFLNKIKKTLEKYDWKIYTYCLLPNHYHLQIKTGEKDKLGTIIQSLQTSHAIYFNRKHKHLGPIFQNRFHSVLVQEGEYFLYLSKYIHLNPVKANLAIKPEDYLYSSYQKYLNPKTKSIIDSRSLITILGDLTKNSIRKYQKFINSPDDDNQYIYSEKNNNRGIFGTTRFRSQFE